METESWETPYFGDTEELSLSFVKYSTNPKPCQFSVSFFFFIFIVTDVFIFPSFVCLHPASPQPWPLPLAIVMLLFLSLSDAYVLCSINC